MKRFLRWRSIGRLEGWKSCLADRQVGVPPILPFFHPSILFLLTLFVIPFAEIHSQTITNSPYSRYGLGELQYTGFANSIPMGGISNAVQNDTMAPFYINFSNPASHASLKITSFDVAFKSNTTQLETQDKKYLSTQSALSYMALGFPVAKGWGASFGLLPYSSVGYKIYDKQEEDSIGDVNYTYEGEGGINQVYLGNGLRPFVSLPEKFYDSKRYKRLKELLPDSVAAKKINRIVKRRTLFSNLSLGVNASYLFGDLMYFSRDSFPKASNFFNTKLAQTTRVSDFHFTFGLQQRIDLKKNWSITLGATGGLETNVNVKRTTFAATYSNTLGVEVIKDTIVNEEDVPDTLTIPMMLGAGMVIRKGDQWMFGFDYSMQDWSSFSSFGQAGLLKNSRKFSIGAQYIPNKGAGTKEPYYKKIAYRAGFRYGDTYLELRNTALRDIAVTFGAGFPLRKIKVGETYSQSVINVGFEFGQRGTTIYELIREKYAKVVIGFTLNDRWFIKRKYD